MPERTVLEALGAVLRRQLAADERCVVLGETVWSGGASGVTKGLYEAFGPERVRETPVSENGIFQAALGLALAGYRPIVEIYSADFLLAVANEVINDMAKWRQQHGRPEHLPITIRGPMGAAGGLGPEHSQCIERFFYSAPGLQVVLPGSPQDAAPLLDTVLRGQEPTLFLEHRRLYEETYEPEGEPRSLPLGRARVVREGAAATIVTWGWMVQESAVAADALAGAGIDAELIDLRTIAPMDLDTILDSVRRTGRIVTVEEAPRRGGVGAEIAATVAERLGPGVHIRRVGMAEAIHPYRPDLEAALIPDARTIEQAVAGLCDAGVEVGVHHAP